MSNTKNQDIRLNRFIAMCGVCSRRNADTLIEQGRITVNNQIIKNFGFKVSIKDIVCVNGIRITPEKTNYILLNKPKGYITTMKDEKGRPTVMTLIQNATQERLVPVGRLDKDTTGLLLFTNNGTLAKRLTHPKYNIIKTYCVTLDKGLKKIDFLKIAKGIKLEDGFIKVDSIKYINDNKQKVELKIHIGKNRIVRRIFSFLGYVVIELDRVGYSCLTKKNLPLGKWRKLSASELKALNQDN